MKRTEIVIEGAQLLLTAERSTDTAIADMAALAGGLVRLRMDGGLSAVVGPEVLGKITTALTLMAEARAAVVQAHADLDQVKTNIGCRTVSTGGEDKGDDGFVGTPPMGVARLRAA